ncbi:hypothetical protein PICMEDRAFT_152312 [Pichia membranifaciens NRRL Y-2026]|uniref:Uncharacterized protein n=1 Tax=Pichia membranifaciens NRRL Y-2026 TaxID=763406 RepID=A0A1E3NJ01_9ASCO|nr:hypothetical protein PICMEDRAFT_152312 [Pichia membranifaciens NRRL Y-2026]ODQ46090.1 hypothetical protein PICMEDRAFT_152312 [Pichia membranifaciens NRRL Y-2026]
MALGSSASALSAPVTSCRRLTRLEEAEESLQDVRFFSSMGKSKIACGGPIVSFLEIPDIPSGLHVI